MEMLQEEVLSEIFTFDLSDYGADEYDFIEQAEFYLQENLRRQLFNRKMIFPQNKLNKGVLFITFRKPKFICLELKVKQESNSLEFDIEIVASLPISKMFALPKSSFIKKHPTSYFHSYEKNELEFKTEEGIYKEWKKTETSPKILLISHPTHIPYIIKLDKKFPEPLLNSNTEINRYPPLLIKKIKDDNYAIYISTNKIQHFCLKSKKILLEAKVISNFKYQYLFNPANLELIKVDGISFEEKNETRFSGLLYSLKKRNFQTFDLKGLSCENEEWENLEAMQYQYGENLENCDFSDTDHFLIFGFNSRYDLGKKSVVFISVFRDNFKQKDIVKRFIFLGSFKARFMCNRMKVVGFRNKKGMMKHYMILDKSFGNPFFISIIEYNEETQEFREVFYKEFQMRVRICGVHEGLLCIYSEDKKMIVYKFNDYDCSR